YSILKKEALPGSEIFALIILAISAHVGGKIIRIIKLPSLLGMLIIGFLFRNLPFIPFYQDISVRWASTLRGSALVIILLKAGLGLDAKKLKQLKMVVFQLSFAPCIVETVATGVSSHYLLALPWPWAIMLGFVVSAVSPAVVVPSLLSLQERKLGTNKGIPTLVIAAASVDDIIAITGFTCMLSISVSEGSLVWTLLKGPLEPLLGLVYGVLLGVFFWFIPDNTSPKSTLVYYHTLMLLFGGLTGMFLSKALQISGAGPLACLTLAFVASLVWKKDSEQFEMIEKVISVLWALIQPFLFSLIGAEVTISSLQTNLGDSIFTLLIGLAFRIATATFVTFGGDLNIKEKIFVAFAWLPKATVQAAVGPQALDYVLVNKKGPEMEDLAKRVLTVAVLSIILTAPIGAALIAVLGPLLLKKENEAEVVFDDTQADCKFLEVSRCFILW
ncbi:sodium/hydrogen exchanger 9B2-like, partial [Uloborus diversus]|uniref:sodium/hydrogen exchanger 9B2-like n=1 Tax=Uloborus diversus TaxID=327109 RepID=UPI00240A6B3F